MAESARTGGNVKYPGPSDSGPSGLNTSVELEESDSENMVAQESRIVKEYQQFTSIFSHLHLQRNLNCHASQVCI